MPLSTATLRILQPAPGVFAYYDGRIAGRRLYKQAPNWVDDGAYGLGVAAYAIVDGGEALVFDSHISPDHAALMRAHAESLGARRFRLVLSHWHDDHVAGSALFADGEIIANPLTLDRLEANRARLEGGDPPIRPLVLPNRIYRGEAALTVGGRRVELRQLEIHSLDATVLLLADAGLMLAGDVVEDTIPYIDEPERSAVHVTELRRLSKMPFARILPAHGNPEVIAGGGYGRTLIAANAGYLRRLLASPGDRALARTTLRDFVADDIAAGSIGYFEPYEAVHRRNVERMSATFAPPR